jgi:hypothetical protein
LEYLIDFMFMHQHNVGVLLLQETWEEGNVFNIDVGGYHIFCRNATRGRSERQHPFKGVAIVLSTVFYEAWKEAGSPPPVTMGP